MPKWDNSASIIPEEVFCRRILSFYKRDEEDKSVFLDHATMVARIENSIWRLEVWSMYFCEVRLFFAQKTSLN